jgi:hypothetical protein
MKYTVKSLQQFLNESIRAEEAHRDANAIQTVIDGKRGMGFITLVGATIDRDLFWTLVKQNDLKTMKVPSNPFEGYIYYRKRYEKPAKELLEIAERYGGFLAYDATEADTRRIGQLLGYEKRDIDKYIKERY